jgi:hypothetical protein
MEKADAIIGCGRDEVKGRPRFDLAEMVQQTVDSRVSISQFALYREGVIHESRSHS